MYIGIDAHKRMCDITALSKDGELLFHEECRTSKKALLLLAEGMPPGAEVAIEASTSGKYVARVLQDAGVNVTVAHPLEVRRRAGKTKKTDAHDSRILAELHRMNWLPRSYLPSQEEDEIRSLLRHRMNLGKKSRMVKSQIHSILQGEGVQLPFTDIFGKGGSILLRQQKLSATHQRVMVDLLDQLDLVVRQQKRIEDYLALRARDHEATRRLMTLPGIDYYSAMVILTEVGDINRFPDAKHLCSYSGLVPRVHQSGDTLYRGGIHKQGPGALRWILVVCAHSAVKARNSRWRREYQRLSKRIGHKKAIVAIARKMLTVVFALLTQNADYAEMDPDGYKRKIQRMNRRAQELPVPDVSERVDQLAPDSIASLMAEEVGFNAVG
jgi:transposase